MFYRVFEDFFVDIQQNIKLFMIAPLLCAAFRAVFIKRYNPYRTLKGQWRRIFHCFRYGFWWGMDFNAYVFLVPVCLISIPGAFVPKWLAMGDHLRVLGFLVYAIILYTAFLGKMIFYKEYHDIYNETLWLGKNAEKHNLLDIFLHQYHGYWILLSYIPYSCFCVILTQQFLKLPGVGYPAFAMNLTQYFFDAAVVVFSIAGFYFFRYGGTFNHDNKPEWDTIPSLVKADIFFARATVDDLVALEYVWRHPIERLLVHKDEDDIASIQRLPATRTWQGKSNPVTFFRQKADGAKIAKPTHIFLIVAESYSQMVADDIYAKLHLTDGCRKLRADPHTFVINNFLPAGDRSRPSIVSIMAGIYDARLELNERESFWKGTLPTALPVQLKKLGYSSTYWYGGNPTYGNFNQYGPAVGFDQVMAADTFCPPDSPHTWVGVYDHVFLHEAAKRIKALPEGQLYFHYIYTTSNHGPYKIPVEKFGYDIEKVMPEAPECLKNDVQGQRAMGTCWYADKFLAEFVDDMMDTYPDSLVIITGDHAALPIPLRTSGLFERKDPSLRESLCSSFAMYHRDFSMDMFCGNTIGCHMNIMPTILDLIAPGGFEYYSLFPSLLKPIDHVVTPYHWMTKDFIGFYGQNYYEPLLMTEMPIASKPGKALFDEERQSLSDITGWIARHPELLLPREKWL